MAQCEIIDMAQYEIIDKQVFFQLVHLCRHCMLGTQHNVHYPLGGTLIQYETIAQDNCWQGQTPAMLSADLSFEGCPPQTAPTNGQDVLS